jgi:cysteinyl-tRNA synthetase
MSLPTASTPYLESTRKIRLYNTLTGTKDEFIPIDSSLPQPKVLMYYCGLTPYDHPHIGHASAALRFDILRRYLCYRNLAVKFQTNVTDVDDKIINRAQTTKENPAEFTARFTEELFSGLDKLNALRPDFLTKVTDMIPQIIVFIDDLIKDQFAYATASGNVYFDISKKADYGKLSGQKIAELLSGTRDREPDPEKKSPLDFALWKRDDSVLSYPSAWGQGRPGWHIECSAMIYETLGKHIDIHGGGLDLKFPHHENEIAQSEGHHGVFANFWVHAGLLTIDGAKMSKSTGNFFTLEQALERFGGELIRFVMLRHHYRAEIGFTDALFRENLNALCELHKVITNAKDATSFSEADYRGSAESIELIAAFEEAMDNDFQTPGALVALIEAGKKVRLLLDQEQIVPAKTLAATVHALSQVLGLLSFSSATVINECLKFSCLSRNTTIQTSAAIDQLLLDRQAARTAKDFASSDRLRDELSQYGVEVLDAKGSSGWRFLP